ACPKRLSQRVQIAIEEPFQLPDTRTEPGEDLLDIRRPSGCASFLGGAREFPINALYLGFDHVDIRARAVAPAPLAHHLPRLVLAAHDVEERLLRPPERMTAVIARLGDFRIDLFVRAPQVLTRFPESRGEVARMQAKLEAPVVDVILRHERSQVAA